MWIPSKTVRSLLLICTVKKEDVKFEGIASRKTSINPMKNAIFHVHRHNTIEQSGSQGVFKREEMHASITLCTSCITQKACVQVKEHISLSDYISPHVVMSQLTKAPSFITMHGCYKWISLISSKAESKTWGIISAIRFDRLINHHGGFRYVPLCRRLMKQSSLNWWFSRALEKQILRSFAFKK